MPKTSAALSGTRTQDEEQSQTGKSWTDQITDHRLIACLSFLLAGTIIASLAVGPASLTLFDSLRGLFGLADEKTGLIIQQIRLPRTLAALFIGAALGLSGAALQGLLRNPLADPGVLGVTTSAGLGAVIAIYYGLSSISLYAVPIAAMITAGFATIILWGLVRKGASLLTLILAGVALNAFSGALLSLAMVLAPNPFTLADMIRWLMGSLENRSFSDLALAGPFMLTGMIILAFSARGLKIMSLGDDVATSLGIHVLTIRRLVIFGSALTVGSSVAIAGAIGFVGLIVPHSLRPFVDHDPARLLFPSALGGACLLGLADVAIRLIPFDRDLNIGVATALIGAPFFLWLVFSTRKEFI